MIDVKLFFIVLSSSILVVDAVIANNSQEADYQVCMDAKYHKVKPGPEYKLYECDAWSTMSCCTIKTADEVTIDGSHLYNFNYSHCSNMSAKCLHHFELNSCFYECSPNVGPWLIATKSSYRAERFHGVPLCGNVCNAWWDNCQDEMTCVEDWSLGFDWHGGVNSCPPDSTCRSFRQVFHNATYFCEHVYGPFDYQVVPNNTKCMVFSFEGDNPNAKVAQYYHEKKRSEEQHVDAVIANNSQEADYQVCMDAKYHKVKPGPEDKLYKCDAWSTLSCCTNKTADEVTIDGSHLYNFNYSHCSNMSAKCLHHFELNSCFYECSPNVGPWLIATKSSYRAERFHGVPLCGNVCNAWWDNCQDEMTCVEDWSLGFDWHGGVNSCPPDSSCRSFRQVFHNATYFCEHVYGPFDYKVVPTNKNCMVFSFEGDNPNAKVAQYYHEKKRSEEQHVDAVIANNSQEADYQVCMDAKYHKVKPGPEDKLYKCDAWSTMSCCTNKTADEVTIDGSHLYNFNYSHCSNMSAKCLHHFELNSCFYECSPNVGPWLIATKSSYRAERFHGVPLCGNVCNAWWDNCQDEMTCVEDWSLGFDWHGGVNSCPPDSTCRSFRQVFHNATYFCEHVYGPFDYKVVPTNKKCMVFSFEGDNPNAKVAQYYHEKKRSEEQHGTQIPPYVPPPETPALQVHGTVASVVIASLIVAAVIVFLLFLAVKRMRQGRFLHQRVPVQLSSIVRKRMTGRNTVDSRSDAEMSFMQYEEDDDEEELEMNGGLHLNL